MLTSVMCDTGGILIKDRALEFFIPGSIRPGSPWIWVVPGFSESVADMVSVLTLCGVVWDLEILRIEEELAINGSAIASKDTLIALGSWYGGKVHPATPQRTGVTLHDIVLKFRHLESQESINAKHFTITRDSTGTINITASPSENNLTSENGLERPFSILRGSIKTLHGNETVELIIGGQYGITNSGMTLIKNCYASHVQCFISGWCASHLYYRQAHNRQAFTWKVHEQDQEKIQDEVDEYNTRGFEFSSPGNAGPVSRTLYDGDSLLIDYGDLYRTFLKWSDCELLDECLYERRQNVQGISWVESDGRILDFQSPWEICFRGNRGTFASAGSDIPKKRWRRLANAIAANTQRPNKDTIRGFRSVVGWRSFRRGWQMRMLKESGTAYPGLRDATPWSWVL
ncbi:hypothetical protein MKX08_009237 [Trichoderma sp. CBMAI-0020]|nr:hypothetical protein MKX08_009237 [Trichoderma sp. CBMAI-0020]